MISRRLIGFVAAALGLLVLVSMASHAEPIELGVVGEGRASTSNAGLDEIPGEFDGSSGTQSTEGSNDRLEPPAWLNIALGILAAGGALWLLFRQRFSLLAARRRLRTTEGPSDVAAEPSADVIAEFADGLIGELELDGDPRQAICRAYAAVEGGFGTIELRRRAAETPLKYLDRVFGRRKQAAPALSRLTDLFCVARFSTEPVDETMRSDAIESLVEIRDHYRSIARAKVSR